MNFTTLVTKLKSAWNTFVDYIMYLVSLSPPHYKGGTTENFRQALKEVIDDYEYRQQQEPRKAVYYCEGLDQLFILDGFTRPYDNLEHVYKRTDLYYIGDL